MTPSSSSRAQPRGVRRWLALCVPPLLVLSLVLVGRRVAVTDAAAAGSTHGIAAAGAIESSADAPAEGTAPDAQRIGADGADGADGATATADVGPDVTRPALELLADGAVLVDLNLATEQELRRLPGIGEGRARKILELRTRLGRFKSVDDLARIKGFGRALLRRLRPLARTS